MPAHEGVGSEDGRPSLLIWLMLAEGDGGMDALATAGVFLFEGCRLDRRGLSRRDQSGAFVPVLIGSRALEILSVLVERAGDLVSRDEITNAVWPRTIVEGSNLPVQIAALRRSLGGGCAPIARQAVDRGAALRQYERRPGTGIFRRRHGRGGHHRPQPHPLAICHRTQFDVHLQGPNRRREA